MPRRTKEILIAGLDPKKWREIWPGFRVYSLRRSRGKGLSIGLFHCAKGVGSTPHRHASNQFMYCLKGEYFYPATGVRIKPGSFYMNPRGRAHGPAVALKETLMLEMYDGPPAPIPVRTRASKIGAIIPRVTAKSNGRRRLQSRDSE